VADRVRVVQADVRDLDVVRTLVADRDVVFHFAAQVSYLDSMKDPLLDLDISLRGTLNVLEACRQGPREVRFLTIGSRMQFGEVRRLPVDETHPMRPQSFYAIHKMVTEEYCRLYHEAFGLWTAFLRLSNPYGPRQQIKHGKYGIVNWFVRLALEGRPLTVFGDGAQARDYFYIDDAVEAFLAAALHDRGGEVFNIGGGKPISFRTMAETIAAATGARVEYVPWPAEWKQVETGDYITDVGKALHVLGWGPKVEFQDGIRRTVDYYRAAFDRYA
jgi:nucleoside-diphosphate-sugar epimerase